MTLTQQKVKDTFDYNPETGELLWKKSKMMKYGSIAGCRDNSTGYIRVHCGGKNHLAHRVVYLWVHGRLPEVIDHINGNRSDNRIDNLREADWAKNNWNRRRYDGQKLKGANYCPGRRKWRPTIAYNGSIITLGGYDDEISAAIAYNIAASHLCGEFAVLNKIPFVSSDSLLSRIRKALEEK